MLTKTIKAMLIIALAATTAVAEEVKKKKKGSILKNEGVTINYTDVNEDSHTTVIKRMPNPICKKVNGMNPDVIWGGDYARKDVPEECKKTFVTTVGKIAPMKIADGVDTYGELEVIEFMKKAQTNRDMLLVDARMNPWYLKGTIPTSVNMSFKAFDPKNADFEIIVDLAGIEETDDGKYDFSNAKTLLLFCNATWCPQSSWAIKNLIKIGYPKEKLKWYRAGMYGWTTLNLTVEIPE